MATGDANDRAEAYRRFRGRDPQVEALLRSRGFPLEVRRRNAALAPKVDADARTAYLQAARPQEPPASCDQD